MDPSCLREEIPLTLPLQDRIALVTGAGQGIGKGIALSLAKAGAHVVINDLDAKNAANTANEIRAHGRRSLPVKADVSLSPSVNAMIEQTMAEFGAIHILVNNAGICIPAHITELTEEQWDRTISTNLRSCYLCSKAIAPLMIQQKWGKIVNVSSKSGKRGGLWLTAYAATKFGIIGFTQSLAQDLAPYGINVNAICPGTVYTPLWDNTLRYKYAEKLDMNLEQVRQHYTAKIPLGREIQIDEIGSVVSFLCSDAASYMTGQAINITGGQEMD
jgi:sorbitol-6-phosphate 2-dehydrogenase